MSKVNRCYRCNKRYRNQGEWNVEYRGGKIIGLLCPSCQTPEENAEAVINQSTLNYWSHPITGKIMATPKTDF